MEDPKSILKDISAIRTIMEEQTKFLSLSGLSGVSAGVCALIASAVAFVYMDGASRWDGGMNVVQGHRIPEFLVFFVVTAGATLVSALGLAIFFSWRMAKQRSLPFFNKTAIRLMISMGIPLVAGGVFCLIQMYHGIYFWVAPTTLIFYGLALLNGSKYTHTEIRWLGVAEVSLGLIGALFAGYGLLIWAIGFGILHILYGIIVYFKYER